MSHRPFDPGLSNQRRRILIIGLILGVACGLATPRSGAGEAPVPSRIHGLVQLTVADHYITPRGLIVEDQGVVFQPLVLLFANVYRPAKEDAFINDVSLVGGVWNSIHTKQSVGRTQNGNWNEIDPIFGVSTRLAKRFDLSVTYTIFKSQVDAFDTSQHLETKLAFNDTDFLGKFALHPYILLWNELDKKATPATTSESFYFEVGIAPGYTFTKAADLRLEAPMRVLFPADDFYGTSSTVGVWEVGLKATLPMKFMPKGYGNWDFFAGFKYFKFENDNLVGWQSFLSKGHSDDEETMFFTGVSTFF